VGAALANKKHGRLTINIQSDGDLNYAPGVFVDGRPPSHPALDRPAQ
jgi:hypothetical protein